MNDFTRPRVTRVCVEVDLSKPLPRAVFIDNGGEIISQEVHIPEDSIPLFCNRCVVMGHKIATCLKGTTKSTRMDSDKDSTKEIGLREPSITGRLVTTQL